MVDGHALVRFENVFSKMQLSCFIEHKILNLFLNINHFIIYRTKMAVTPITL